MAKLELKAAAALVTEVTLLTGKMDDLASAISKAESEVEANKKEILRRQQLEATNVSLEAKIKGLNEELTQRKDERDERIARLTDAGWQIPMPKVEAKGRVTL